MTALDDALAKADEVLRDDARPDLHPMTKPHDREVDLARALKAVAEALDECDRLDDRGAVLRIRAAIARNLREGK